MKTRFLTLLFLGVATGYAQLSFPPDADNEQSRVSQWIGPVEVTITYHSPNVHGPDGTDRTGHIWGELVPYGYAELGTVKAAPWRAGANECTTIYFSHDVKVEGKDIKAGTYGFFVVVEQNGPWTLIFSSDTQGWGSYFYDASADVLRVPVTAVNSNYTEWLTYGFDDRLPQSTVAYLQWENKKVPFKIEVPNVNQLYLSMIKSELKGAQGFDNDNWKDAAVFCLNYQIDLNEALNFIETALNDPFIGKKNFTNLKVKSEILAGMGKTDEAKTTMLEALNHPTATVQDVHVYGRQLLAEGKNQEALEIFKLNRKIHAEDNFTTYVGLARGYAAVGDKKNAIKNWEMAIKNLPADQQPNLPYYQGELNKLKS
jgi:predicted negative regulator of RcsB-dependent stress response